MYFFLLAIIIMLSITLKLLQFKSNLKNNLAMSP